MNAHPVSRNMTKLYTEKQRSNRIPFVTQKVSMRHVKTHKYKTLYTSAAEDKSNDLSRTMRSETNVQLATKHAIIAQQNVFLCES